MILKSGQINFEKEPGVFACVVIRDGKIHNMTEQQREMILEFFKPKTETAIDLNDML